MISKDFNNEYQMKKNKLFFVVAAAMAVILTTASCEEDNKYESKLPAFDRVDVSPSTAIPGDTIGGTIYFSYEGSYIKGTYVWDVSNATGTVAAGEVEAGPVKERSFSIAISEDAKAGTYTLTLRPRMMAAYAGESLYLDYSSMGDVKTQLTIIDNN